MSIRRSPPGGGIGAERGGSQPNLTSISDFDVPQITFRNKRKLPSDSEIFMSELADIKKQMAEMMSVIKSATDTQSENINKLCQDVNNIKHQVSSISSSIDSMSYEQNKLKTDVSNLAVSLNNTETKIERVEADIKSLQTSTSASVNSVSYDNVIAECLERNTRLKNIILTSIPEPTSEVFDKANYDKHEVIKISKLIFSNCPEPTHVLRLGKPQPNKIRPIKACFASEDTVKYILRNKSKFNTDDINIYSDQTPYQRDVFKKLKEELECRISNGERGLYIKYIKGVPKIIDDPRAKNSRMTARSAREM